MRSRSLDVRRGSGMRSVISRSIGFFALWLILSGADSAGLVAGAVAVAGATWTSLMLFPAAGSRFALAAIGRFTLRFLYESVVAGTDVARRALDPRLPLRPGYLEYSVRLPAGALRNTFCTLSSLLPGTLPVGSDKTGALRLHCLDVGMAVLEQLSEDEALLTLALGGKRGHG
jgi:multicomponent Na+:H+ antiporter subunit E